MTDVNNHTLPWGTSRYSQPVTLSRSRTLNSWRLLDGGRANKAVSRKGAPDGTPSKRVESSERDFEWDLDTPADSTNLRKRERGRATRPGWLVAGWVWDVARVRCTGRYVGRWMWFAKDRRTDRRTDGQTGRQRGGVRATRVHQRNSHSSSSSSSSSAASSFTRRRITVLLQREYEYALTMNNNRDGPRPRLHRLTNYYSLLIDWLPTGRGQGTTFMRLQRLHVMCWHYWYIVACTRHREGKSTHPACVGRTGACVHEGTLCIRAAALLRTLETPYIPTWYIYMCCID